LVAGPFTSAAGDAGLDLPPGYRGFAVRELKDALAHAVVLAPAEGAGTLVWTRRFDIVEWALVVEPDEPLRTARRVLYAGMNALADAVAVHCPPEKPVVFGWPDTLQLDGGIVGGVQLVVPEGAAEEDVPPWLAMGFMLRSFVHVKGGSDATSLDLPLVRGTSLESEGFEIMDGAALIGSFARHFMVYVDRWQELGFAAVGRTYLERLPHKAAQPHRIAETGDLEIRDLMRGGGVDNKSLIAALAAPQWRDPETGEPWL
jgi:biotin-(acetyl-CoA carboxylase) ligase